MIESVGTLRAREFSRLDTDGHVYLDYTGAALYPESLVDAHAELLRRGVFGNPHSRNPTSRASTELVEKARRRIGEFFDADPREYEVIFTLNASGALKLVGEAFPFAPGASFRLAADNHNSVNGIREFAEARGADVRYLQLAGDLTIPDIEAQLAGADPSAANLFAYPAQSNFSGVKHPLEWIELAHGLGYDVLLDSAAYVPTNPLSLRRIKPDFATVSFYKMFGFPTGVGALLARRDALAKLRRPWFGGGTVRFASAQNQVRILYSDYAAFEDGTLNFLAIAALPDGLDFLAGIGMDRVHTHVTELTGGLLREMSSLRHSGGEPLVRIYGPPDSDGRGGTIAFNLIDPGGTIIDCRLVEQAAVAAGISLRTGYFCNPGAAETSFELPVDESHRCYEELAGDTFTLSQFSVCLHDKPVGAVRVSVGIPTNDEDIRALLRLLERFRDAPADRPVTKGHTTVETTNETTNETAGATTGTTPE